MLNKPALHGRDHCAGGADPIPCLPKPVGYASVMTSVYFGDTALSVPANSSIDVTWRHFASSDQSAPFGGTIGTADAVFGTGRSGIDIAHNTAGDKYLQVLKSGMLVCMANMEWEDGNYTRDMFINGSDNFVTSLPYSSEQQASTQNGPNGSKLMLRDVYNAVAQGVSPSNSVAGLTLTAGNYSASAKTIRHAQLFVFWWPADLPADKNAWLIYGSGFFV